MRTLAARRRLLTSALLFVLVTFPAPGNAAPPNHNFFSDVTGSWFGEFVSAGGKTGFASLDIPTHEHRRFTGTFVFHSPNPIAPPNPCFVMGTVSHSGQTSLVGANEKFFLHAHRHIASGVMNLEYMRLFADGTFETGTASIGLETGGGT